MGFKGLIGQWMGWRKKCMSGSQHGAMRQSRLTEVGNSEQFGCRGGQLGGEGRPMDTAQPGLSCAEGEQIGDQEP